jgi:hypothetical protein
MSDKPYSGESTRFRFPVNNVINEVGTVNKGRLLRTTFDQPITVTTEDDVVEYRWVEGEQLEVTLNGVIVPSETKEVKK